MSERGSCGPDESADGVEKAGDLEPFRWRVPRQLDSDQVNRRGPNGREPVGANRHSSQAERLVAYWKFQLHSGVDAAWHG